MIHFFPSFCSCWSSNQSKVVSLVLTASLTLNRDYLSHQKRHSLALNVWSSCMAAVSALSAYWYELWTLIPAFTWLQTTSVTGGLCPLSLLMQCETKLFCFKSFIWSTFCSVIMFFCFVSFLMAVNAFFLFYVYSFYQKRFLFFVFFAGFLSLKC